MISARMNSPGSEAEAPRAAARAVMAAHSLVVTSHVNPDGDAVGSVLALTLALESRGRHVTAALDDGVPETYRFLPGSDRVESGPVSYVRAPDLIVILDCGDIERAGRIVATLPRGIPVVNIDHHGTNTMFGDVNWVDASAAAVGEQVYRLLRAARIRFDRRVATCLFTAISTDTGSFKYKNTTAGCLQVAARLVAAGADVETISRRAFETRTVGNLKLLGAALSGLETGAAGRLAWMAVTHRQMREFGVDEAEMEGFPAYPRMVPGVAVGMFFRETQDGKVKVGFRSHGDVDVSALAARFGGGGHPCAAGCTVDGALRDVMKFVIEAATEAVEALGPAGG